MHLSKKGVELLTELEGRERFVYLDSNNAPTIGVGHKLTLSERSSGKIIICDFLEPAKYKDGLTEEQIDILLFHDLIRAELAVNSVQVPLAQNQFDSLVSFIHNIGITAFHNSTLLKLLNQGYYDKVPEQLARWHWSGGKPNVLTSRRKKEIALWEV